MCRQNYSMSECSVENAVAAYLDKISIVLLTWLSVSERKHVDMIDILIIMVSSCSSFFLIIYLKFQKTIEHIEHTYIQVCVDCVSLFVFTEFRVKKKEVFILMASPRVRPLSKR